MVDKEYSLRFLLIRAAATVILVAILLLGLRFAGVTASEENVHPAVVEETRSAASVKN